MSHRTGSATNPVKGAIGVFQTQANRAALVTAAVMILIRRAIIVVRFMSWVRVISVESN